MITYNDIYEAARKERYSEQLQKLSRNFIQNVAAYLGEKKSLAMKDDDVFSDMALKTKKQLENAITLFKELMVRRRKKIFNLILVAAETGISKQDFDNMLEFERGLFDEVMKCVDTSDKSLNNILNGQKQLQTQKNDLVLFLDSVEEFVDMEGEKMGPFEKGQIANIPIEIVDILIADKKCERIES